MTKNEAIKSTIKYWIECIEKTEKLKGKTTYEQLVRKPVVRWDASSFALCQKYYFSKKHEDEESKTACMKCPLKIKYGKCNNIRNKNAWFWLSWSKTWEEWRHHAKRLLIQLKSLEG